MKIVKETIRRYYKYQYSSWTQPVLSANGTIGGDSFAIDSYNAYGNNYAYYAFDGVTSGTDNVWSPSSLPSYITIYNPSPLNITSITVTDWSRHFARTGTIEASNDNITYTTLTSWTSTNSTSFGQWTIDLSSNTGYYKYYRYKVETSTSGSYANTVEITLTATQRTVTTGTSSDYDYYEDVTVYDSPVITTRSYYKYTYEDWTQPVLTSNTSDAPEMVVSASSEWSSSTAASIAFDNNTSTRWSVADRVTTGTLYVDFADDMEISSIVVTGWSNPNDATGTVTIYSDKNKTQQIGTHTFNSNASYTYTFSNPVVTKELAFYTTSYTGYWACIAEIKINARKRFTSAGTPTDYSFYVDTTDYKAIKF